MSLVFERLEVITFIRSRTAFASDDGFVDASNKHFGVEISAGLGTMARLPNCTKHLTLKIRRSSPMLRKFPSLHHVWMHFRLSSVALKAILSKFHTRPTFSLRLISNSIANPRFLISQSLLASFRVQQSLVSQAKCLRRGRKINFSHFRDDDESRIQASWIKMRETSLHE